MSDWKMKTKYTDVNLIKTSDISYRGWCRSFKLTKRGSKNTKTYHLASQHEYLLAKWERAIRQLLSEIAEEENHRILRYRDSETHRPYYRELDFVAKRNQELCFCEIKLKQNFKTNIKNKASGWRQLNKSIAIASGRYGQLTGLSICVDMSEVYGLDSIEDGETFCNIGEIEKYLFRKDALNVIWIKSSDIFQHSIQNGLLTLEDGNEIKDSYKALYQPMTLLENQTNELKNNPFGPFLGNIRFSCFAS